MKNGNKISRWDWLLIIGAVIAPMTGFRIWKIGPAEVVCFLWALKQIEFKKIKINLFSKFFSVFFFSMIIGTLICLFINPIECVPSQLLTWVFLIIISCTLYNVISINDKEYNCKLFDYICRISTVWYGLLYVYSITVSKDFLGVPIWYSRIRFSGCGTNPHQIAVLMCGISCWYLYRLFNNEDWVNIPFFVLTCFLLFETKSSTGKAALFLGCFVYIYIMLLDLISTRNKKITLTILFLIIAILIIIGGWNYLYEMSYEWISDDPNGIGRFKIWSSFIESVERSPFFGLGPGFHAEGGKVEFHNSYFEIFAATGLIGFASFLYFTYYSVKKVLIGNMKLIPVIVCLYGYSMAGFACRRLAYWIVFVFIVVISENTVISDKTREKVNTI